MKKKSLMLFSILIIIALLLFSIVNCKEESKESDEIIENFLPYDTQIHFQIDKLNLFLKEINYGRIKQEFLKDFDDFDKKFTEELGIPFPSENTLEKMGFYVDKPLGISINNLSTKDILLFGYLKDSSLLIKWFDENKKKLKIDIDNESYNDYKIYSLIRNEKESLNNNELKNDKHLNFHFITYPLFFAIISECEKDKSLEIFKNILNKRNSNNLFSNKDYQFLMKKSKEKSNVHLYVSSNRKSNSNKYGYLDQKLFNSAIINLKIENRELTLNSTITYNTKSIWNLFTVKDRGIKAEEMIYDNPVLYLRFGLNIQETLNRLENENQIDKNYKENISEIIDRMLGIDFQKDVLKNIKGYFIFCLYEFTGIDKLNELDIMTIIGINNEESFENVLKKLKSKIPNNKDLKIKRKTFNKKKYYILKYTDLDIYICVYKKQLLLLTNKNRLESILDEKKLGALPFYKNIEARIPQKYIPNSQNVLYLNNTEILNKLPGLSSTEVLSDLITVSLFFQSIKHILISADINSNDFTIDFNFRIEGSKDVLYQLINSIKKLNLINDNMDLIH